MEIFNFLNNHFRWICPILAVATIALDYTVAKRKLFNTKVDHLLRVSTMALFSYITVKVITIVIQIFKIILKLFKAIMSDPDFIETIQVLAPIIVAIVIFTIISIIIRYFVLFGDDPLR